ncbi:MAG: PHP domain-containing protein [Succinivibrionaceae bacterium]|nr:PHP domain-containing protein [Succinivibrionaceae bacterium]
MLYDLHTHSNFSDGACTVAELIGLAVEAGITHLALTDHDTVAGLPSAAREARGRLALCPGIECSTSHEVNGKVESVHVVGLFIDPGAPSLLEHQRRISGVRVEKARRIGALVDRELGTHDAYTELMALKGNLETNLTRGDYARYIFSKFPGTFRDTADVFRRYLRPGCPCYSRGTYGPLGEAIAAIHEAGGIAVLAHLHRYERLVTDEERAALCRDFVALGGDAMEVACSSQSAANRAFMADLCRSHGLLASQGSDFHGPQVPRPLGQGLSLPEGLTPVWESPRARFL